MPKGQRRLAAIMFTDMVGYTALGQKNESLSLSLVVQQRKLVRPILRKNNGREVKTIGDAFLVEFSSALEAVNCAGEIQSTLREANKSNPEDRRFNIRIGIHLGDVVHQGKDVVGDAVNIASRIEPLSPPGGICVSGQVYISVVNKVRYEFESLGTPELKNVVTKVEVYQVVGLGERRGRPLPQRAAPAKDRIAVLPFTNISPSKEDEYFADGMTEELISTMSRIGGLKVIARTSVMLYKGAQKRIDEIAKELGVGAVLEGSVRKAGDRLRITVQLIDSQTSDHIWSDSFDRELRDIFAVQSEISETVAGALKVHLLSSEKERLENTRAVNPEGYILYLKGRFYWNERTKDSMTKAKRYFEQAVEADPSLAIAYAGLGDCYGILLDFNWMSPVQAGPLALQNARWAIELDENLAEAHASLGLTLMNYSWDFATAEREYARALDLRPNYAPAHHWYAVLTYFLKRYPESYFHEKQAIEIDPQSRIVQMGLAASLARLGDFNQALQRLDALIASSPDFAAAHSQKSSVCLWCGEYAAAAEEAKKAVDLEGDPFFRLGLAEVLALGGRKAESEEIFDDVMRKGEGYAAPVAVASVEFALDRWNEGFKHLEKGLEERDNGLLYFRSTISPAYAKYRSDPRWKDIEARLGLPGLGEERPA